MEVVGERPLVVVDYAHTPDALEKVLATLRPVATQRGGRLCVVFGAGGDRDPAKRPVMGAAASRGADRVFITSDNPRSEDPAAIIDAVARGASGAPQLEVDRRRAIEAAVRGAAPEDVVLVAGKGHESYQEIRGKRQPFSDQAVARDALAMRSKP
jgi:UDP-N-acetylmuramoyl-L-alanyl-D-glutamate--2,6-diaminopimelate ligase